MEKFWANVRAGHETLPKYCGCIESETSKHSGFTSSKGKRDRCATRRMLMGSLQKDPTQWESTAEHLGEEKARVYRSTVARLNYWAVDIPDLQHAVRVCSKAAAKPTADDWLKLKRIGRYVKGSPHIGIMFVCQKAHIKLTVQSDSDWAGERKTRKSVSSGNIRFGHHLLRSWSKDQSVIALSSGEAELYAACMAAKQTRWNCKWTQMQLSVSLEDKVWAR